MFTGVSDVKMEEGSMRCDANISIRPYGQEKFTKTELKNLNSFNNVRKGLAFSKKFVKRTSYAMEEKSYKKHVVLMMRLVKTILMRVKEGS